MSTKVQKILNSFNVAAVKKYRDEHIVSLYEARKVLVDRTISEALAASHGWEDLKAIMQFQHTYHLYRL